MNNQDLWALGGPNAQPETPPGVPGTLQCPNTISLGAMCPDERCPYLFETQQELRQHLARTRRYTNHVNSTFACDVPDCPRRGKDGMPKTFGNYNDLMRHKREVHGDGGGKRYPCPWSTCRKHREPFKRPENLRSHMQTVHREAAAAPPAPLPPQPTEPVAGGNIGAHPETLLSSPGSSFTDQSSMASNSQPAVLPVTPPTRMMMTPENPNDVDAVGEDDVKVHVKGGDGNLSLKQSLQAMIQEREEMAKRLETYDRGIAALQEMLNEPQKKKQRFSR